MPIKINNKIIKKIKVADHIIKKIKIDGVLVWSAIEPIMVTINTNNKDNITECWYINKGDNITISNSSLIATNTDNEEVSISAGQKEGYGFDCWTVNNSEISDYFTVNTQSIIEAKWKLIIGSCEIKWYWSSATEEITVNSVTCDGVIISCNIGTDFRMALPIGSSITIPITYVTENGYTINDSLELSTTESDVSLTPITTHYIYEN